MRDVSVISGGTAGELAGGVARRLGAGLVNAQVRTFSDGESKITLSGRVSRRRAVVVQSVLPPVDTSLLHALSLVAGAAESSRRVTAVIPYMGYARQDREFLPGEIVTTRVLGRLFRGAGASEVVVVDIHSMEGLGHLGPGAINVSAMPELARHVGGMRLRDPLVVSPDRGGEERAAGFAAVLGTDHAALEKSRDRRTGRVRIESGGAAEAAGRDVVLVDDMISSGGSIVKAARFLRGQGCRRMFVACTHALLVGGAAQKIRGAGVSKIVSTNTVPGRTAAVDASGPVARALA